MLSSIHLSVFVIQPDHWPHRRLALDIFVLELCALEAMRIFKTFLGRWSSSSPGIFAVEIVVVAWQVLLS